jgi:hypothetical protein
MGMSIKILGTIVMRTIGIPIVPHLLRSPRSKLGRSDIKTRIYTKIKRRVNYLSLDLRF